MSLTPAQTRAGYLNLWNAMAILAGRRAELKGVVAQIAKGRKLYEVVEKTTGVPWWFVGIIHMREASCSWLGYLGNGQSWRKRTTKEPFNRGPFTSWEEGAIDALTLQAKRDGWTSDWSLPTALFRFEAYNGWGYFYHGVNSAYVWSWTSEYSGGKYVGERQWSSSAKDPQPGCAAMLRGLIDAGHVALPDASTAAQTEPQAGGEGGSATTLPDQGNAAPAPTSGSTEEDPVTLHVGLRGDDVRALQARLRSLGYTPGAIDGAYGESTADAVAAFQRRNGLKGDAGAWRKSYDAALSGAGNIVPDVRTGATPRDLEDRGDRLMRTLRLIRNMVAWVAAAFGVTIGGGQTVTATVGQAHDAADQLGPIVAWAHSNAWVMLIAIAIAAVALIEFIRVQRAKEYATGAFQGPAQDAKE